MDSDMAIELTSATMTVDWASLSDTELWDACRGGNREAFRVLVDRYKRQAHRIAYTLVGSPDDAWDLSQDAFVRIWRARRSFKPGREFFPWFYSVIANLCRNHLRARGVREKHRDRLVEQAEVRHQRQKLPDEVFAENELKARVWVAIGKLPEGFRAIIIMKHFRGLSYEEIAKELDIPLGTVMSRLYYARRKLREHAEDVLSGALPFGNRSDEEGSSRNEQSGVCEPKTQRSRENDR